MESTPALGHKPSLRERFNALLAEFGPLLVVVHFSIFALVFAGAALAIKFGFGLGERSTAEGTSEWLGAAGTWGGAYIATQMTKPLRFGATLLITPPLGALLRRLRRRKPVAGAEAAGSDASQVAGPGPVAPAASLDETPSGRS
jgi:hypothetical protein